MGGADGFLWEVSLEGHWPGRPTRLRAPRDRGDRHGSGSGREGVLLEAPWACGPGSWPPAVAAEPVGTAVDGAGSCE